MKNMQGLMKKIQSNYCINYQNRKLFIVCILSIELLCCVLLILLSHHVVVVESYTILVSSHYLITQGKRQRITASDYDSEKRNHHHQLSSSFHYYQLNINHKKQKVLFISKSFSSLSSSLMSTSYSTDTSNHESSSEKQQQQQEILHNATTTTTITSQTKRRPICVYRNKATKNVWNERIELEELTIGQELKGVIVQQLLYNNNNNDTNNNNTSTKSTGPKLYVDVGVGRYNRNAKNPKWKIQNAMIRLSNKGYMKDSVARKKISKLNTKDYITVYVNRIDISSNRLEVVLKKDEVQPMKKTSFIPIKDIYVGQEFNGTVKQICTYGIFIDIGTNRLGLLHIQKIADLYQKYINPNQISKDTDITIGLRMKIQLLSKDKKRLFFDFTNDVKELLIPKENEVGEVEQQSRLSTDQSNMMITNSDTSINDDSDLIVSKTELINTKVVSSTQDTEEEDDNEYDDDEEYDAYDEEREIEDQLGLGFY